MELLTCTFKMCRRHTFIRSIIGRRVSAMGVVMSCQFAYKLISANANGTETHCKTEDIKQTRIFLPPHGAVYKNLLMPTWFYVFVTAVCISLLWTTTAAEAMGFVGIHSCVAWFVWHTDKDAFANAVRLCTHMPIHCAGHVCSRAATSPVNCTHMPDVYRRARGRRRQMFQYNVNTARAK